MQKKKKKPACTESSLEVFESGAFYAKRFLINNLVFSMILDLFEFSAASWISFHTGNC